MLAAVAEQDHPCVDYPGLVASLHGHSSVVQDMHLVCAYLGCIGSRAQLLCSAFPVSALYVSDVSSQQVYCVLDLICGCSLTRTMFLILFPDQPGSQTCES